MIDVILIALLWLAVVLMKIDQCSLRGKLLPSHDHATLGEKNVDLKHFSLLRHIPDLHALEVTPDLLVKYRTDHRWLLTAQKQLVQPGVVPERGLSVPPRLHISVGAEARY